MTDIAGRFEATADDDYLVQSADAANTVSGTGLVVQVTGPERDVVELDAVARRFDQGADRILVRADGRDGPRVAEALHFRELTVPDLAHLKDLLARGLR